MGEAPAFLVEELQNEELVTSVGDKTYIIGGRYNDSVEVKVVDGSTKDWHSPTVVGTKPKMCRGHSAFALNDDRILVLRKETKPDDSIWFLEVNTKFVKEQSKILGTELVAWSKGVIGDSGKPIVISGPSGVGKGTLIAKLMMEFPSMFGFSVSHTTRAPREKEKDGVHYHFTDRSVMEGDIKEGKFLESASVHGNLYGTSWEAVETVADAGKRCILDIDVQGARSVRASSLEAIFIFISPPSIEELERRLSARGTETKEQIEKRVQNASAEIEQANSRGGLFDHILENDDLEKCYNNLKKHLGLDVYPAATCESSAAAEVTDLPMNCSLSKIGNQILISSGNEKREKASRNMLVLDVSSLRGGAPGRTRGLKLFPADSISDGTNATEHLS